MSSSSSNVMKSVGAIEKEIRSVDKELAIVDLEIAKWKNRQRELLEKKNSLKKSMNKVKSDALSSQDWGGDKYKWSSDVRKMLKEVFKLKTFRAQQQSAINATMSGVNAIVVMPTGAGKSLCYQLPALVEPGLTVVISPLVSLMEDQVRSLTSKNIPAKLMTSTSPKEETNAALNMLKDRNTPVKLLYVTPERLAKSKRFMANLQKCYEEKRLQRIAIDEVHCCSQWGHDFRPDYKFLGILKNTFPNIPILGLTATATASVLVDVKNMLNIPECLVIKSPFNRPNLFYQILEKPSSKEECLTILESLLKYRYRGESGIIYTTSIKNSQDIAEGLRKKKLKVACYHANLDASTRSNVHTKWHDNYYQAIVATVAFGMGIDKPDVRFIIHHTISKSMENYYQESGRAGRDGLRAECVTLYRMQDIFNVSSMLLTDGKTDHLNGMIKYCLNGKLCRRLLIAEHFDENWGNTDCNKMCDICNGSNSNPKELQLEQHCKTLLSILNNARQQQTKLTAQMLLDAWFLKGPVKLRHNGKEPHMSRSVAEDVVAYLLVEGYIYPDYHFTSYSTVVYIKKGPNMDLIEDPDFKLNMHLRNYIHLELQKPAPRDNNAVTITLSDDRSTNSVDEPLPKRCKKIVIDSDSDE